jgi:cytochrome c biogenesis protein CcdA
MPVLIVFGFIAGLATGLAPCVLPALPIVVAGSVAGGRLRPLGIAAGVAGSFTVFTLGLSALLGESGLSPSLVRDAAIVGLAAFGLTLLVPRLDHRLAQFLTPVARLADAVPRHGEGFLGGVVLGGALGLAWTPCAGPILAGLTAAIATVGATGEVTLVLAAYAIGAAVPIALIGWGGRRLAVRLGPGARALRPAMGALMVLSALVILAGLDTRLTAAALTGVPGYDGIQTLERVDAARDGLARIQGLPEGAPPLVAAARGADPDPADALGLPNAGPAPELRGISAWFNTPSPLRLADLRGKVVLLDFWTYSCVNCVRTLPHLRALHEEYAGDAW